MQEEFSFGEWVRKQRRALDLSRQAFAKQVGCAEVTLRRIEAGTLKPSKELASIILEKLGISQAERPQWISFSRGVSGLPRTSSLPSNKPSTNLPAPITSFIGRKKEQDDVIDLITKHRLVTITGPGGIGKTRLSIEVARDVLSEFPDGAYFVALAPLRDQGLIAITVVQALGFVEVGNLSAEKQLRDGIGNKRMLLILDNCEHLIEGVAKLVSDILSICPHIKIIVTSRESLRILGEWLYAVPMLGITLEGNMPLDLEIIPKSPALALFAERARAVRSDFVLTTENVRTVSIICMQLDGLPLAIELIAARMRLMSPQALLARWSSHFILTADGMRPSSERQKSLNNAIHWSYNLLPDAEQKLFAYLSVFSGSFTLETAEAMFSQIFIGRSVSNLVMSLLDKSLLQHSFDQEERVETRYAMLVTIQEFAWERLLEIGEETKIRNYHLTYFCELAEQARSQLHGAEQLAWLDRLEDDYSNIHAALKWAQESGAIVKGLRLATDLEWFWTWRAHLQEPSLMLENLLNRPLPADQIQARAKGHYVAGRLQSIVGNKISAEANFKESIQLYLLLGPEVKVDLVQAKFYLNLMHETIMRKPIHVRQRYDDVLKSLQETGDQWQTAFWISNMGLDLVRSGDFNGARQVLEQSLRLYHDCRDLIGASRTNRYLAQLALEEGNYAEARTRGEENLRFYRQARLNIYIDIPLWLLGVIETRDGDYARAKAWYTECLLVDQQIGLLRQLAECFVGFAGIACAERNSERAAQVLGAAAAEAEARGDLENFDQAELQRLIIILREELGNVKFEALASHGRTMTREQVIAWALKED